MSIATLKRKTYNGNPRIAPISGQGPLGFALNGTRRITGVVGPINLGQSGNRNNAGSCLWTGNNGKGCINDPKVIKTSVKNTRGMLAARNINCPERQNCRDPMNWYQPTSTTQGQYIERKQGLTTVCYTDSSNISISSICKSHDQLGTICKQNCKPNYNYIGTKNLFRGNYTKKPPVAITQGEYLRTSYRKNRCIPVPQEYSGTLGHFPPLINNTGCNILYTTQNAAVKGGLYGSQKQ